MKKKLLLFVLSLFAFAGYTMAKNDIYFKVDKVDIMQGNTAAITFCYDADPDAYLLAFQVQFILPKGFHITSDVELNPEIEAQIPEFRLDYSERDDGNPLPTNVYLGFQLSEEAMPTGEGIELFTCYVECDEDVESGEYVFTTTYLEFGDKNSDEPLLCEQKAMVLNVIGDALRVISEEDLDVPEASLDAEDILVKRTIKADTWSTLTLPFSLSGDQAVAIFGDDAQIAEFIEYTYNEDDRIVMNFEEFSLTYGIYANCPFIIKTKRPITQFLVKDVVVDADEEHAYILYDNGRAVGSAQHKWYAYMYGTLHNGVTVPVNGFILRDNKFYVSNGSTVLKGLRAYFVINGYEYFPAEGANISFMVDGEETSIEGVSVNGNEIVSGNVFNVNGSFMGRAESVMKSLPKGIYIVDRKKVVVK